jgi:hypothetical protein
MRFARSGKSSPDPKESPSHADKSPVANGRNGCATGLHPVTRVSAPMSTNEIELKNIRLLLVEDNPADARVVERHLKDAGHQPCHS